MSTSTRLLQELLRQQIALAVEIERAHRWSHCFAAIRLFLERRDAYERGFNADYSWRLSL